MHTMYIIIFFISFLKASLQSSENMRIYSPGHQFPEGSDQLLIPKIIALSIHMGRVKYPHMRLTLESMRWNPTVKFVLINIVSNTDLATGDSADLIRLAASQNVHNFHVKPITYLQLSERVQEKLGIHVPFNSTWFYKMTDYKPTLAFLFPELLDNEHPQFKYWAYVDLDLVWGNFSRFAYLFQGDYAVVTSGTTW